LKTSIAQLVGYSAIHFTGAELDRGKGFDQARLRNAWSQLADWDPRAVSYKGTDKLVVASQVAARVIAGRGEVLAVGVALQLAIKIYGIPYPYWQVSSGLARWDLNTVTANGRMIKVEARGRFMRRGWKKAIQQVHKKFNTSDFSIGAGILFAPRSSARTRKADVLIVDPTGETMDPRAHPELRSLLRHYAPFFAHQNFNAFAKRLLKIAEAPDKDFNNYLRRGDPQLLDPSVWFKRTSFRWEGMRFQGTAWDGIAWPRHLTGVGIEAGTGAFYWGLWDHVIEALRHGELASVTDMQLVPQVIREGRLIFILLDDATALAWAPTSQELTPSMFD
jgi:hypothetical protein